MLALSDVFMHFSPGLVHPLPVDGPVLSCSGNLPPPNVAAVGILWQSAAGRRPDNTSTHGSCQNL